MSRILSSAGALVDRIKINAVSREWREGRAVWIKRRRWTAAPIMACANHFFRLAGNPIQAIDKLAAWQRWEVDCFLRLPMVLARSPPMKCRGKAFRRI